MAGDFPIVGDDFAGGMKLSDAVTGKIKDVIGLDQVDLGFGPRAARCGDHVLGLELWGSLDKSTNFGRPARIDSNGLAHIDLMNDFSAAWSTGSNHDIVWIRMVSTFVDHLGLPARSA